MPIGTPSTAESIPWQCDYFPTPQGRIFRAYVPARTNGNWGILFINPLGEEAKSAFSVMTDCCRAYWRRGWAVGRFDYLGTGDSEGQFTETKPLDWLRDARQTLHDFRWVMQIDRLALLGLRLGGNIAATLAAEARSEPQISALILWEPIIDFVRYLRHLHWVNRDPQPDGSLDHYGWTLSSPCQKALVSELQLSLQGIQCPLFLASNTAGKRHKRECESLDSWRLPLGSHVETLHLPLFWEPIGRVYCDLLIERTAQWLAEVNLGKGRR